MANSFEPREGRFPVFSTDTHVSWRRMPAITPDDPSWWHTDEPPDDPSWWHGDGMHGTLPDSVQQNLWLAQSLRNKADELAQKDMGSRLEEHLTMQVRYLPARAMRVGLDPTMLPAVILDGAGDAALVEMMRVEDKRKLTAYHFLDQKTANDLEFIEETTKDTRDEIAQLRTAIEQLKANLPSQSQPSSAPAKVLPDSPAQTSIKRKPIEKELEPEIRDILEAGEQLRKPSEQRVKADVRHGMYGRWQRQLMWLGTQNWGRAVTVALAPIAAPVVAAITAGDAVRAEIDHRSKRSRLTTMFSIYRGVQDKTGDLAGRAMANRAGVRDLTAYVGDLNTGEKVGPLPEVWRASGGAQGAEAAKPAGPDATEPQAARKLKHSGTAEHLRWFSTYGPARLMSVVLNPFGIPALIAGIVGDAVGVHQGRNAKKAELKKYDDLDLRKQIAIGNADRNVGEVSAELDSLRTEVADLYQAMRPTVETSPGVSALTSHMQRLSQVAGPTPEQARRSLSEPAMREAAISAVPTSSAAISVH